MLAQVAVCSAQAVGMAIGLGGNGGARWQGRHSERLAVVRARLGAAQSGLGRGLTATAGQGKLNQGHMLLNCQCECSDGSAVAGVQAGALTAALGAALVTAEAGKGKQKV